MDTIVVGMDGSPGSIQALRHALEEAERRGTARIRAVFAWSYPAFATSPPPFGAGMLPDPAMGEAALEVLEKSIAEVGPPDELHIERVVEMGRAATVLLKAAENADLIVLGCRGHGGLSGMVLGSVSQKVAAQATCPVLIVPTHD